MGSSVDTYAGIHNDEVLHTSALMYASVARSAVMNLMQHLSPQDIKVMAEGGEAYRSYSCQLGWGRFCSPMLMLAS